MITTREYADLLIGDRVNGAQDTAGCVLWLMALIVTSMLITYIA